MMAKPEKPAATPEPEPQPPVDTAIVGGPGVDAPPAPPPLVTVKVGAREFQVSPEMAEAYAQRERDYEAGIARQGQELGELRARQREYDAQQARLRAAVVGDVSPQRPDVATELFTDPATALQRHKAEILAEWQQQQSIERGKAEFWDTFYAQHPDLSRAQEHWLVETVLQRHFRDLAALSVEEGQKKLGDLTRQAMLSIIKNRTPAHGGSPRTVIEGASPRPERSAASQADEGPASLSAVIQARRAARRRPATANR
jgi:hypothetical protein